MTWQTVLAATDEFQRLLGTIRQTGGIVTRSWPCPAGFLVTYVIRGAEPMFVEIVSPEQAAEDAAWWLQAFQSLVESGAAVELPLVEREVPPSTRGGRVMLPACPMPY